MDRSKFLNENCRWKDSTFWYFEGGKQEYLLEMVNKVFIQNYLLTIIFLAAKQ
jgi:hypothetical protein